MRPLIGISAEVAPVTRYWGTEDHHVVDADYVGAVRAGGGLPVVLPVGRPDEVDGLLARLDGLVLSGGNDLDPAAYGQAHLDVGTGGELDPARDAFDFALVRAAIHSGLPLLAICRGLQVVNVALGGTLVQHLPDHPQTAGDGSGGHEVVVGGDGALADFRQQFGTQLAVNSYHHQAVDRAGEGVRIAARAPDGVIEALVVDAVPNLVAVQWHPETLLRRPEQMAFFRWLTTTSVRCRQAAGGGD